jgi:hypothetical protein
MPVPVGDREPPFRATTLCGNQVPGHLGDHRTEAGDLAGAIVDAEDGGQRHADLDAGALSA